MMDLKHFSHNHGLAFHQAPQGSQIHCSGCKSPGSGNFYVCRQCSYFLHEQCFRAARSLKHPSHPLHPLSLVPFPTYPSGSFLCNSCNLVGHGFSYSCSACEFDIHVHCALTPNPNPHVSPSPVSAQNYNYQPQNPIYLPHSATIPNATTKPPRPPPQPPVSQPIPIQTNNPQSEPPTMPKHFSHPHALKPMEIEHNNAKVCSACEWEFSGSAYCCTESHCNFSLHKACFDSPREVRHKSHPQHPLTLLSAPPNGVKFDCYACYRSGKAYAYTCPTCNHNLHIDCIEWPETVTRADHKHPLTLYYSAAEASREANFMCDVCESPVNQKAWRYYCRECGFGTHTECIRYQMKRQRGGTAGKN